MSITDIGAAAGALADDSQDTGVDHGDRAVWARQLVSEKRRLDKSVPDRIDLETAIVDIAIKDTIAGSSSIVLSIADPEWALMDSGFFDADRDGKLDAIEINYPAGTEYWWRLTQIGVSSNETVPMTFMERVAVLMMQHRGPLKVARGKKTRAEFLKMLADKVTEDGGIVFHSDELHKTIKTDGRALHLGDSLAVGVSAYLTDDLGDAWRVITKAKVGRTTAQGRTVIEAMANVPRIVIVQLGSNDDDPAVFETNARAIIDGNPDSRFLWSTVHRATYGAAINTRLNTMKADYGDQLKLADWNAAVNSGKVVLGSDGLHAGPDGYRYWAKRLTSLVKTMAA